jgi:hypothetical protein
MVYGAGAFLRFAGRLISRIGDPAVPWTARRAGIFSLLFVVYPVLELAIWAHLLLDELLFPRYRRIEIRQPVFVVGNFRSGTTFLHRLLAQDGDRFATMKMWEILFAPSISQRKVIGWLAGLDRWLGGPVARRLSRLEDRWEEENPMHRAALTEPEEDDYVLLHIWSALTIGLSSGLLEEAVPYVRFDSALPPARRRRILRFYQRCLQRHLFARGGAGRQYLAKNPALTPKLGSVLETLPQARFVCLVRDPREAIASFVNMMHFSWRVLGSPTESDELRQFIIDMAGHWYRYPMEFLKQVPDDQYLFVRYDDLVADPKGTVLAIYRRFGLTPSEAYVRLLEREAREARGYQSRHQYSIEQVGLSAEQLTDAFQDVIDRFRFGEAAPSQATPEDGTAVAEGRGTR